MEVGFAFGAFGAEIEQAAEVFAGAVGRETWVGEAAFDALQLVVAEGGDLVDGGLVDDGVVAERLDGLDDGDAEDDALDAVDASGRSVIVEGVGHGEILLFAGAVVGLGRVAEWF